MSVTQSYTDNNGKNNDLGEVTPSPIIGKTGKSMIGTSYQEISPSPIIGKTGKSISKEKLPSKNLTSHIMTCGCNDCFLSEFSKVKHITIQKADNLIENFIRNKTKNPKNLDTHKAGCLCVDHLIKKRVTSNFSLEMLIERIQQKEKSEVTSKEQVKRTETNDSMFKQKSNHTKISRNNTLPSENQKSSS